MWLGMASSSYSAASHTDRMAELMSARICSLLLSAHLVVMWVDMQKAGFIGRSLDQLLQDGMRMAYDKHMDQNVYTGLEEGRPASPAR